MHIHIYMLEPSSRILKRLCENFKIDVNNQIEALLVALFFNLRLACPGMLWPCH